MAAKAVTYPDVVLIPGCVPSVADIVEGIGYVLDSSFNLTVAGAGAKRVVYPKVKETLASGKKVTCVLIGSIFATLGTGGATDGDSLTMGANGKLIVGVPGTDHILGYAVIKDGGTSSTALANATINVWKIA